MPPRTDGPEGRPVLPRAWRAAARAPRPDLVLRSVAAALRVLHADARVDLLVRRRNGAWSHDLVRPRHASRLTVAAGERSGAVAAWPREPVARALDAEGGDLPGDAALRALGLAHRVTVPIRLEGLRALVIVSRTGPPLSAREIKELAGLAGLLTPALAEQARLEKASRARERARFVQRFTASVNRSLELDDILRTAVLRLKGRLELDRVELVVVSGRGQQARRCAVEVATDFRQVENDLVDSALVPRGPVEPGESVHVDGDLSVLTEDPSAWDLLSRGCRARVVVSLVVRGRAVGVLTLAWRARSAPPRELVALLAQVAQSLAIAVDNARLHDEVRRRFRQVSALYEVGQALSSIADTASVTERVLGILHDSFEFQHSAVLNLQEAADGSRWLVMQASRGYSPRGEGAFRIRVGDRGITSRAVQSGRLVHVADVRKDPSYVQGVEQGRSEVAIPLEVNGRIIGVLDVESTEVAAFSEEDIETLKLFATQVAIALERARLFEEVRRQAMTDSLTGLLNQRFFQQKVDREIVRSQRTGRPFTLALVDIDDFKRVNDEHGHVAGNEVILAIGDALQARMRAIDAAARFGGDEFAVVLSETDEAAALRVMEDVQADLRRRREDRGLAPFSVSIGLAAWKPGDVRYQDVVAAADAALYRAKELGKDRCVAAGGEAP